MEYISTRNKEKVFSFQDVFLKGLAPDGGLFVPKKIPSLTNQELINYKSFSYNKLALNIILKFCRDEFDEKDVKEIINNAYKGFRTKDVVEIKKLGNLNLLELFHGPTLAFKDIAMQVIGNMYEKILKKNNSKINIVVATSGDTGAAAISAIKNRNNMKIFVLHPENKVTEVQRKFMTTVNSNNVFNIAVASNFDDCQNFVKLMFADKNFSSSINMSGVNSINWARIMSQIINYFYAYFKVSLNGEKINFSVPTGNFGDIYAGYVAKKMGLPIDKLIIATNNNDILKRVIKSGIYKPLKVQHTVSPSMDIQVASNFERLLFDATLHNSDKVLRLMDNLTERGEFELDKDILSKIKESFCSESLTENETRKVIKETYENHKILIDPHTAVAIGAANKLRFKNKIVVLSTAHPAKFSDVVLNETKIKSELPKNLKNILVEKENFIKLPNELKKIKSYIFDRA